MKRRAWRRWLLLACAGLLSATILYTFYLDHIIRARFEGQRWAIPAAVYGRPLALYPGARVSEEQLRRTLDGLGYSSITSSNLAAISSIGSEPCSVPVPFDSPISPGVPTISKWCSTTRESRP